MLNVNDIIDLSIVDLNYLGKGVGKYNGIAVFVDGLIQGDKAKVKVIEIKKNYAVGKIVEIIEKSSFRVQPRCEYYQMCGGCQIQELCYEKQLEFKESLVFNTIKKSGVCLDGTEFCSIIGMDNPFRYRNKTVFAVGYGDNGEHPLKIGTYEQGTYNIVEIDSCLLQDEEVDVVIQQIKNILRKYKVKAYCKDNRTGELRHIAVRINSHKQMMVVFVTNGDDFKDKYNIVKDLVTGNPNVKTIVQNVNKSTGSLILGSKNIVLYGEGVLEDEIGELKFLLSPHTFFQVNRTQTEKLYDKAIEFAAFSGNENCFDLYCGIGTISLMAAKKAQKVIGIEEVSQSIEDAKLNASANSIENVEFIAGKVENVLPKMVKKGLKADVVIVDPPRKGCEKEVLEAISVISPKKLVYVSCNPATLARDLKILEDKGYTIKKVQPVDMFSNTVHCECVVLITRAQSVITGNTNKPSIGGICIGKEEK